MSPPFEKVILGGSNDLKAKRAVDAIRKERLDSADPKIFHVGFGGLLLDYNPQSVPGDISWMVVPTLSR
jgi:hypothetical protein